MLAKKTKAEVHYSNGTPAEHCGNCLNFLPASPVEDGRCRRVSGTILAGKWCTLWVARKDAERKREAA